MSSVEDFLSSEEEFDIIAAIRKVESKTSGEIRIHIESSTKLPIEKRAQEVFHALKMDNTALKNGVLIYIAVADQSFGIYGDSGIDKMVPPTFWTDTRDAIQNHFATHHFGRGIICGIETAGLVLEQYFPWHHSDQNELSDNISKGTV